MIHFIGFYNYTVILTYMSLVSAVFGMILAHNDNFTGAVLCLMLSGLCDAFDGTVARSKKDRTEDEKAFGIQLDSLCDVVSFGVFPAFLCYCLGVDSIPGLLILCAYCVCAVIRLAFFNVQEAKRQQTQTGSNKIYRGLPVTSISMIFPLVYCLKYVVSHFAFSVALHVMAAAVAFLFVWDVPVKKPDFSALIAKK